MSTDLCKPFPTIDFSGLKDSATRLEKIQHFLPVTEIAPEFLHEDLAKLFSDSSVEKLHVLFQSCRSYEKNMCSHAALAALLQPDLATLYSIALYRTPARYHDLIVQTLSRINDEASRQFVHEFLLDVDRDNLEVAITQALERGTTANIFGKAEEVGSNSNPTASLMSEYLQETIDNVMSRPRTRLLAVRWLPFFAKTKPKCLALIRQQLKHDDPHIRAIAALYLSNFFPDADEDEDVSRELIGPLQDKNFEPREHISFPGGGGGFIENMLTRQLFVQAKVWDNFKSEKLKEICREHARDWFGQMSVAQPAKRELVEEKLQDLYRVAGAAPPEAVLWFDNPAIAGMAAKLFSDTALPSIIVKDHSLRVFSKVADYTERLVVLCEQFPEVAIGEKALWSFGQRGWVAEPEYENEYYTNWCGTSMLTAPHRRARDTWDVIEIQADRDPTHGEAAWSKLIDGLRETSLADLFEGKQIPKVDVDNATTPGRLHYAFWISGILDRGRLRAVGHRSLLNSLGVYPHEDDGLEEILRNCGGFFAFDEVAIVVERPAHIVRDNHQRLHNAGGKSIEYPDGWGVYSLNGMTVNARIVTAPETITVDDINKEYNAEIRRVMIERYGFERYISDSQLEIADQDKFGVLYTKKFDFQEPLAIIELTNRTAEPDGSFKRYFLSVPPFVKSAREAVAWTFGMNEREYDPAIES